METGVLGKIEKEVESWSQADVLRLASRLIEIAREKGEVQKETSLDAYRGVLQTEIDPLEYQRQIRAEWE